MSVLDDMLQYPFLFVVLVWMLYQVQKKYEGRKVLLHDERVWE